MFQCSPPTGGDGGFQSGAASLHNISNDIQLFSKNGKQCSTIYSYVFIVFIVSKSPCCCSFNSGEAVDLAGHPSGQLFSEAWNVSVPPASVCIGESLCGGGGG